MNFRSIKKLVVFLILIGIFMNSGIMTFAEEEFVYINLETNKEDKIDSIKVKRGEEINKELLPVLEDESEIFSGWFIDEDYNKEFENMVITEDISLYAKWEEEQVKEDFINRDEEEFTEKKKGIMKQNQKPSNVPNVTIFGEGPIPMDKIFSESVLDRENKLPYITGYKDGTFRPDDSVTREEFAMIIFRILKKEVIDNNKTIDHRYRDITNLDYEEAIATLSNLNILNGYKDNTFKPIKYITRGEVAVVLARVNAMDESTNSKFKDIDNFWGKGYIGAITDKGWISGYSDGTFRPNRNIKRSELVRMINNALDRREIKNELKQIENKFTDVENFRWYYEDVIKAANNN